jgi:hypothetical protein
VKYFALPSIRMSLLVAPRREQEEGFWKVVLWTVLISTPSLRNNGSWYFSFQKFDSHLERNMEQAFCS